MVTGTKVREKPNLMVIDAIVHKHNVQPGAVIPILQEIQEAYGYVPPVAIQRIAENIGIPASEIYGIVTFYAQFRLTPPGENMIRVCHGTACHLNGAEKIAHVLAQATGAKEGETSRDGKFTVERVACFGCCSLAPTIMLNGEIHGRLNPEDIRKVLGRVQATETPAEAR